MKCAPARLVPGFRTLTGIAVAVGVASATTSVSAPANAQPAPPPPVLHQVKYTVFTEAPFLGAEIYYRDVDPPNFAEYSHNPYVYSPNVEADLGPKQMWTKDVMLANPDQWAMVTATSMYSQQVPNFHCVLAVDGVVVATNQGPKGALCSIRVW